MTDHPSPQTPEPAWSTAEVAAKSGQPQSRIRALCRTGRLPATRVGRDYRIPAIVARAYIAGHPIPRIDDEGVL